MNAEKKAPVRGFQRVEKGVNLKEWAILHAEETSRNRAEFRFLASGCRTYKLARAEYDMVLTGCFPSVLR